MHPFTLAYLTALATTTLARLWLARRHLRHVAAHGNAVPAEFSGTVTLDAHHKAAEYTSACTRLGMVETMIGALLLLGFTLGGGLQALAAGWARLFGSGGYAHGIAIIASVMLVSSAIDLPLGLYRTFVIEARFGFNRMTLRQYAIDLMKQVLIGITLGLPLLFCVLWLMAQMGETWWIWVWLAWVGFNLLIVTIYPTLIAPIFNRFTPLQDEALKTRIDGLLAKCGFRTRGLFVMDGSRRSSHGNAYFTGFGAAKRIVIFDTLLARLAPAEIEAVLAHELGHFTHHHVLKRMGLLFALSLGLLWMLGILIGDEWFYSALNVSTRTTATALVLFFLAVPPFAFLLQPLTSLYSRRHEYQADSYAARHAAASDLMHALVKLYQDNAATLTPDPLHSAVYDTHPPAALRIARLQSLRAS